MTDNAWTYTRSRLFRDALAELDARHILIPPRRPQVNGKVERFNRTLLEEWAYVRLYRSNDARVKALSRWVSFYNSGRPHTALGGRPPMARVNNANGNYIRSTPQAACQHQTAISRFSVGASPC